MVQPTPFQRLLQDLLREARTDPGAVFGRLDAVFGKTTSEAEVQALSSFATNLGVGTLGRVDETAALLTRFLAHPQLAEGSAARRSVNRALAVTLLVADRRAEAEAAIREGVTSVSEQCRFAGACAQTFLARGRPLDALPHLRKATALTRELEKGDDVIAQTATVALNLLRAAEPQCQLAHELVVAAAQAMVATAERAGEWTAHHQALFQLGKAHLLAGQPARALAAVQQMLQLERAHQAPAVPRFYSASIACRAQAMRGQVQIARAALAACQDFAQEAERAGEPLGPALEDLQRTVAQAEQDAPPAPRR